MNKHLRLSISVVAGIVSVPIFFWLYLQVHLWYEKAIESVPADLAEPYGNLAYMFFYGMPITAVASIWLGVRVWKLCGQERSRSET